MYGRTSDWKSGVTHTNAMTHTEAYTHHLDPKAALSLELNLNGTLAMAQTTDAQASTSIPWVHASLRIGHVRLQGYCLFVAAMFASGAVSAVALRTASTFLRLGDEAGKAGVMVQAGMWIDHVCGVPTTSFV